MKSMITKFQTVNINHFIIYLEIKRHISAFEHKSKIYSACINNNIYILHRKLEQLDLWQVNETSIEQITLLAQINNSGNFQIITANISNKAKYIAYSDCENTVILSYNTNTNKVKKLKTIKGNSAKFLFFDKKEENLIIINQQKSKTSIFNIKSMTLVDIKIDLRNLIVHSADYYQDQIAITTLDKQLISIDLNSKRVNYNLPNPDTFMTQTKFLDAKRLLIITEENRPFIIDVDTNKLNEWTTEHMNQLNSKPENYLTWYNKVIGITNNESIKDIFILYTDYNYIKIDLSKTIPRKSEIEKIKHEKNRNQEWQKYIKDYHGAIFEKIYKNSTLQDNNNEIDENNDTNKLKTKFENENFKITSRFASILYMTYLNQDKNEKSLLVIENDWAKIIKEFPDVVSKHKYGS